MRTKPLSRDEITNAQRMFEVLPPEKQEVLLDLQERIEECEGVNMRVEITGGIPYEYWCDSCKKNYTRMYKLLEDWYNQQLKKMVEDAYERVIKRSENP